MTYMNPAHPSAELEWWDKATQPRRAGHVMKELADWTSQYMLRREKDVIAGELPKKTITTQVIEGKPGKVYDLYERGIIQALKQVHKHSLGGDKKKLEGM